MRSRSKTRVKLNIQEPCIDGLPDSYKEYVVLGSAHHELITLGFCFRHRPMARFYCLPCAAFFDSSFFWQLSNEALSYTIASCQILKRLNQLRAFILRIVNARIDGMVNKLSHGN